MKITYSVYFLKNNIKDILSSGLFFTTGDNTRSLSSFTFSFSDNVKTMFQKTAEMKSGILCNVIFSREWCYLKEALWRIDPRKRKDLFFLYESSYPPFTLIPKPRINKSRDASTYSQPSLLQRLVSHKLRRPLCTPGLYSRMDKSNSWASRGKNVAACLAESAVCLSLSKQIDSHLHAGLVWKDLQFFLIHFLFYLLLSFFLSPSFPSITVVTSLACVSTVCILRFPWEVSEAAANLSSLLWIWKLDYDRRPSS